jgi:hypothetical protein
MERSYEEIVREVVSWHSKTRSTGEYRRSACEDYPCEIEDYVCCSAVILEV